MRVTERPQAGQKFTARLVGSLASQWGHFSGPTVAPLDEPEGASLVPKIRPSLPRLTVMVAAAWPGMPDRSGERLAIWRAHQSATSCGLVVTSPPSPLTSRTRSSS